MSSPGLSWDAMLKVTRLNLDLISDIDMPLFIEKGLGGGISCKPIISTCKTVIHSKKVI